MRAKASQKSKRKKQKYNVKIKNLAPRFIWGLAVVMVMVATAKREKNGKQTQIQQSQFVKTEDGKPKTDNREKMENKANVNISNIV